MRLFDTNVLIYGFDPQSDFHEWAREELSEAILNRAALINPVVLAELGVGEEEPETLSDRLRGLGVSLITADRDRYSTYFPDVRLRLP